MMNCNNCNREISESSKFCEFCGANPMQIKSSGRNNYIPIIIGLIVFGLFLFFLVPNLNNVENISTTAQIYIGAIIVLGYIVYLFNYAITKATKDPKYIFSILIGFLLYFVAKICNESISDLIKSAFEEVSNLSLILEALVPAVVLIGITRLTKTKSIGKNLRDQITLGSAPLIVLLTLDIFKGIVGSEIDQLSYSNIGLIIGIAFFVVYINEYEENK